MKTVSLKLKTLVLFFGATTSLLAVDAVNFNANTVMKALYRNTGINFFESVPTVVNTSDLKSLRICNADIPIPLVPP